MRSVGIKVLKNKLSEYVRIAEGGETVLVTDRDRVVAELVPPQPRNRGSAFDAKWAELIQQGLVTPALNPGKELPPRKPVMSFEQLMAEIEQDRENR